MRKAKELLRSLDYPVEDGYDLKTSGKTFNGGNYRVEIPSVEGPATMESVIKEAELFNVKVNRVSQGSGIMQLSDGDIQNMAQIGAEEEVEVCLFIGPRMNFDIGGSAYSDSGNLLG